MFKAYVLLTVTMLVGLSTSYDTLDSDLIRDAVIADLKSEYNNGGYQQNNNGYRSEQQQPQRYQQPEQKRNEYPRDQNNNMNRNGGLNENNMNRDGRVNENNKSYRKDEKKMQK